MRCVLSRTMRKHTTIWRLALQQEGNETESRAEFNKAYDIAPELKDVPHP